MIVVAELSLWAALPLLSVGAIASIIAAWTGQRALSDVGGRLLISAVVFVLIGLVGLAYALVTVRLDLAVVAAHSGFQLLPDWRFAALWIAPVGAALVLSFLIAVAGAVSHLAGSTRRAAARTGWLAALGVIGLAMVVTRASPFAALPVPASAGMGLPRSVLYPAIHAELWSVYLAVACAAFAFAAVIADAFVQGFDDAADERRAVSLTGAFASIALVVSAWRVYSMTGSLIGGKSAVFATLGPTVLVTLAYLHGPGGLAAPDWARRWRRVLGVALFPTALGAAGAVIANPGGAPALELAAAGLAVGVVSGSLAGLGVAARGSSTWRLPGFGSHAFAGGALILILAGVTALSALLPQLRWGWIAWSLALAGLGALAHWLLARPAGRVTDRFVLVTFALAAAVGALALFLGGTQALPIAVAGALAIPLAFGIARDLKRWRAARLVPGEPDPGESSSGRSVWKARSGRRLASVLAHAGIVLVVLAAAGSYLASSDTWLFQPGRTLEVDALAAGKLRLTYLGLSRFQEGGMDRTVATLMVSRPAQKERIVAPGRHYDFRSGESSVRPALSRGLLSDVVIELVERGEGEDVTLRASTRPLASLFWPGAVLVWASLLVSGASIVRWRGVE